MKNIRKFAALLTIFALLLSLTACVFTGNEDTQPSTEPEQTTAPTEATLPPETEETQPEETEPAETEPQIQSREPEGTLLNASNFQYLLWSLGRTDPDYWYEMIFMQEFTDPTQLDFGNLLSCGVPGEVTPAELTQAEKNYLTDIGMEHALDYDVSRVPRETVETMLCTYFNLTPEMVEQLDLPNMEGVYYFRETDCFYGLNNSYSGNTPNITEAYRMADGSVVLYFTRDPMKTLYRAVLKQDVQARGNAYRVLEITEAELDSPQ